MIFITKEGAKQKADYLQFSEIMIATQSILEQTESGVNSLFIPGNFTPNNNVLLRLDLNSTYHNTEVLKRLPYHSGSIITVENGNGFIHRVSDNQIRFYLSESGGEGGEIICNTGNINDVDGTFKIASSVTLPKFPKTGIQVIS